MTKIIAEIGVNWDGDLERAKFMIIESKRAGADFVKFQLFNESNLGNADKNYDRLKTMILDLDKLSVLRNAARKLGIGFGVSTMYPEALDVLEEQAVPVDFIKIRYADCYNVDIARRAVDYCKKRKKYVVYLLVSTGEKNRGDYLKYNLYHTDLVRYLYCVPEYPPRLGDVDLSHENLKCFDGYSNHVPSKFAPMIAVALGLEFVEIHVMIRDSYPIDRPVSLTFDELKEVCDFCDFVAKLKG